MSEVNAISSTSYQFWVKAAAWASTLVAVLLITIKIYAWLVSGASSILASATDSLLDLFASLLNLVVLKFALAPPDNEHKFGHGKAESLAGIAQAAFISASAILLFVHGLERLFNPQAINQSEVAIVITIISLALTLGLVWFQRWVVLKTQSIVISADALHYQSDILLNIGVLVAVILSESMWPQADGVFTVLVAFYLLYGVKAILGQSLNQLLDHELSASDISTIEAIIKSQSKVLGHHQLKTRQAGPLKFVQVHIELPAEMALREAHEVADSISMAIEKALSPCEVIIHQDPIASSTRHAQ
ncbi:cation diffusion facilitator family transporter [Thalassotalea euphylliae]|uniref:cation diffusion facilitator family transporter n=1 Tax=Thalassotalea euphylliae TaxID=1655234 RepID=UPI00362790F8